MTDTSLADRLTVAVMLAVVCLMVALVVLLRPAPLPSCPPRASGDVWGADPSFRCYCDRDCPTRTLPALVVVVKGVNNSASLVITRSFESAKEV